MRDDHYQKLVRAISLHTDRLTFIERTRDISVRFGAR